MNDALLPLPVAETMALRERYEGRLSEKQLDFYHRVGNEHALIRKILARAWEHVRDTDLVARAKDGHLDTLIGELSWVRAGIDSSEPIVVPDEPPLGRDVVMKVATTGIGGMMEDGADSLFLRRLIREHHKLRVAAARARGYLELIADAELRSEIQWAAAGMPDVHQFPPPARPH